MLASGSPRRRELLERVGLDFRSSAAGVDETWHPSEAATDYVLRVAADKAHAVFETHNDSVVLAADTAVVLDGEPLGQPRDADHAAAMLTRLSGRSHEVLTAMCVLAPRKEPAVRVCSATVTFAPLTEELIDWYVRTGEPRDKAGAYAVQGIGAVLVAHVDGDPTTVVGLPLGPTLEMLVAAGVSWPP